MSKTVAAHPTTQHGLRSVIHGLGVLLMGIIRAAATAGLLIFILLSAFGGLVLVGLLVGAAVGILLEVLEERARGEADGKPVMIAVRAVDGVIAGFIVGALTFGRSGHWQLPTAIAAAVGAAVGIAVEALFTPGVTQGLALAVVRLIRILFKAGAGAVGGGALLVFLGVLSISANIPWVSVVAPSGSGLIGVLGSAFVSTVVTLGVILIMLALYLGIGIVIGTLVGLVVGAITEFSSAPSA